MREGDDCFHFYFFDDSEPSVVSLSDPFWIYDMQIMCLDSVHEFCSGSVRWEASTEKLDSELSNGLGSMPPGTTIVEMVKWIVMRG